MAKELILGLDIGSSSVRAALYDYAGTLIPSTLSRRKYEIGISTQADRLLEDIVAVVDEVLVRAEKRKGEITYIASSAFWHSLVGVDFRGRPTTQVFTWADTRSQEFTKVLRKRFHETEVHHRTGTRFHSSFWPAKLLWLRGGDPSRSEGAAFKRTARWLSMSDFVQLRLCGDVSTSISMASATGIFDQQKCVWDPSLLRYLKLKKARLPLIAARSLELSSKLKKRWPRLRNAQWLPSIGDGAANNIGSGCLTKSRAALTIGTSGAMRIAYKGEPPKTLPPGLWCYRIDEKRVVVGGALSDGGGLYSSLKKDLNLELSDSALGKEMARRGANSHGLTVMPFFFGERSTGYNENARGSILGLTASHDAIDILQAAMEAVAFRFAEIFDQLKKVAKIDEIVVSGGALDASPVWTQIIADVLGRDLLVSNEPEASLRGAVLLALESTGKIKNLEVSTVLNPKQFHPKCHEVYKAARKRHTAAYKRLLKNEHRNPIGKNNRHRTTFDQHHPHSLA
jgi:gluconokinase